MKPLGPPSLSWCHDCNLAVLDSDTCPKCRKGIGRVPCHFDIRPAFPYDLGRLKRIIDGQYGEGCYERIVPDDRVVLFGIDIGTDIGYKVICDGYIVGSFEADEGVWSFIPNARGASVMSPSVKKRIITVTSRGISMALRGRGILSKDILDADPEIAKGDTIFVRNQEGEVKCIARSASDGNALKEGDGTVVRKAAALRKMQRAPPKGHAWEETVELNKVPLDRAVKASVDLTRRIVKRFKVPYTVSLSGGKDSLATLLIVLKAGIRPDIIYADTHMDCGSSGLVKSIAKRYGLKIITYGIPEDVLYRNLERLGPPAIDYRWCCKVHQMGPFNILASMAGEKSLSFIGIRRYEGTARMRNKDVWVTEATPNQICASPIREWNALHVWMFLTREKSPYNKLYEKGYDRIGCYYCPVAPVTTLKEAEWDDPVAVRWKGYIDEFGRKNDMPKVWYDRILWKYRGYNSDIPGVDPDVLSEIKEKQKRPVYRTRISDGTATCGRGFDPSEILPFLPIIGLEGRMENGWLIAGDLRVSPEGDVSSVSGNREELLAGADDIFDISMMATSCLECTVCTFVCKRKAIRLNGQRVELDGTRCNGCRDCMPVCPAIYMLRRGQ